MMIDQSRFSGNGDRTSSHIVHSSTLRSALSEMYPQIQFIAVIRHALPRLLLCACLRLLS
jgi:hypothetical protein